MGDKRISSATTSGRLTTTTNRWSRRSVNVTTLVSTMIFLYVAVQMSAGNFAKHINTIGDNLDKALSDIMTEKHPNYTKIRTDYTYVTKHEFHPRGMSGLYNITQMFMDFLVPRDIYPEGFLIVKRNRVSIGSFEQEWKNLLVKYWALLLLVICVLLIVALMPLCGICFCCCRFCGRCGARTRPCDKRHDCCKKFFLGTILICLGTLLLFTVVCVFVSNEQMQDGVDNVTDNLRYSVEDVATFIDNTNQQLDVLLNRNYEEFEARVLHTIEQSHNIVYDQLAIYSNATLMTTLVNIVEKLPDIRLRFEILKHSTRTLRAYALRLNEAVRKIKIDLLGTLAKCSNVPKCAEINKNISMLQTNIHFNKLPDISEQIAILDKLDQEAFERAVRMGRYNLERVKNSIGKRVNQTLQQVNRKISLAGQQIKFGCVNVTRVLKQMKYTMNDYSSMWLRNADNYIEHYGKYRYYAALGISCTLLLICTCVALGLVCGVCGKRPDVYGDDDCCNKGAGSQFLICSVMIMFWAGFVFSVAFLVGILGGISVDRMWCEPFANPTHSSIFKVLEDNFDVNAYLNNPRHRFRVNVPQIGRALEQCYNNDTLYNIMNVSGEFDMDHVQNYMDRFNISSLLNSLNLSHVAFDKNFHIIEADDNRTLQMLANSDFATVNFDYFKDLMEENFTTFQLTDLSNQLHSVIELLQRQHDANNNFDDEIVTQLHLTKMNIDNYQKMIVEPMVENATAVVSLAKQLEQDLKLGHSSFQEAVYHMLRELDSAERTLKTNGTDRLRKIATDFTSGVAKQIEQYLNRVVHHIRYEVGKCGPIGDVIRNVMTDTCNKIILPWNGFWFSVLCSVLLFIPTITISVKLAKLYQKYNPYREHLFETEYLYDAYGDRENVPLNSRNNKAHRKRDKKKHKQRYEDRPMTSMGAGGHGSGAEENLTTNRDFASSSSTHHNPDHRYADMAPKHWEELPSGVGPPRYQRAPTEYERPPPYYYPGVATTENP